MNLKHTPFVALLIVLLATCNNDQKFNILFEDNSLTYKDDCKQDQCAEVNIVYIQSVGSTKVSEKINSAIIEFIISSLNYNIDDAISTPTIEIAAESFLDTYKKDKAEFTDISPYFAEINVSNTYQTKDLICFEMKKYLYTGGAHGYGTTWYLNIAAETGEKFSTYDLVGNIEEFTQIAEKAFREKTEVPTDGSINATGFWFDNDEFYLPETIGFQDSSVVLLYNPYEIASYADGTIEILIPIEDVRSYLKVK